MSMRTPAVVLLMSLLWSVSSFALETLKLEQVTDNAYAIVGPLGYRTPENLGNNATFGFVVTDEGVLLIDPGGTYKGAAQIHKIIRKVTDQPVRYVVNTGGQDHRWLGNHYFKGIGATVIASKNAVADQDARLNEIFSRLSDAAGDDAVEGTVECYADIQFEEKFELVLGGVEFHIIHPGAAHSPGDAFVWLPQERVLFSGDIIYADRLLNLSSVSTSKSWASAFEAIAALKPEIIVPGHGAPTTLEQARRSTYRYLMALRSRVGEFMQAGGEIHDVAAIDQSEFSYLANYEQLKGRNVQQVYQEMEWE